MFKRVEEFNKEIVKIGPRSLKMIDRDEHAWLAGVMAEERNELILAFEQKDFIGYIDALMDSIYFCLGGLARSGLTEELVEKIFDAIHTCNMNKVRGKKSRKITSDIDAIKPEDWVSPEEAIINILEEYKYEHSC